MQRQRIFREFAKLQSSPPPGISITARDEKLSYLDAQIIGPEDSPYQNGIFKVEVFVSEKYPFTPPSFKFLTKVYHPNIDDNGRICMDLTKIPPKGTWRPTISLEGLLIAIRTLLENPNADDPLMADIAEEYKTHYSEFIRKAKAYTEKYAR